MALDDSARDQPGLLVALRNGVLLGLAALVVIVPVTRWVQASDAEPPKRAAQVAVAPAATKSSFLSRFSPARPAPRYARFDDGALSPDAQHVAHWAVHSGDHQRLSFVIVDKVDAQVHVFNPRGELVSSTPALMGAAHGDHTVPGIGDKPLSKVLPEEKTTPAGRFVAEPGTNLSGEDVVWVDYDAAVSMHRVRPLVAAERRLERLASPGAHDNRISFGCINLPVAFYEQVLSPTVLATGAVVYILPEVRTPQEVFGSYDVIPPAQLARR